MIDYIYYRIYLICTSVGDQHNPSAKADKIFRVLQMMNIATIVVVMVKLGFMIWRPSPIYIVPFALTIVYLNEKFITKRHKEIIGKYAEETEQQIEKGYMVLAAYTLISFGSILSFSWF